MALNHYLLRQLKLLNDREPENVVLERLYQYLENTTITHGKDQPVSGVYISCFVLPESVKFTIFLCDGSMVSLVRYSTKDISGTSHTYEYYNNHFGFLEGPTAAQLTNVLLAAEDLG